MMTWEKFFESNLILLTLVFGSILCNNENGGTIAFPGPINYGNSNRRIGGRSGGGGGMSLEAEIQLAQEYSQIENFEDFLTRINGIPPGLNLAETAISSRFGGEERSNYEIPKFANCAPELKPVSLKNSTITSMARYIPSCTRVPRCGGCCGHASLSCQATDSIVRNFQVIVTEYDVNQGLTYKRKEIVPIEEHTKCACKCKTKAEHCNDRQEYLPKECRCACRNIDEESKCLSSNDTKSWDEDECVCRCRGSFECTTGSYYDHNTCSCKRIGGTGGRRRHVAQEQGKISPRYDSASRGAGGRVPPVFTISADDPRRRHKEDPEA